MKGSTYSSGSEERAQAAPASAANAKIKVRIMVVRMGWSFVYTNIHKAAAATSGDFRFCILISRRHFAGETPHREKLRTKKRTGQRRFCKKSYL